MPVVIDNTASSSIMMLRNTTNQTINPGYYGTGDFIDFWGYNGTPTGFPAGVTLGGLGPSLKFYDVVNGTGWGLIGNFNPALSINQGGAYPGLIVSMQATAAGNYSALLSGYDYGPLLTTSQNSGVTLNIAKNGAGAGTVVAIKNLGTGDIFDFNVTGATIGKLTSALNFSDVSNGNYWQFSGSANPALTITETGAYNAAKITQAGAAEGLNLTMNSGSAGYYSAEFVGYNYGPKFSTSQNGGSTLLVEKDGTGAGSAEQITNKGTGNSLTITNGTATNYGVTQQAIAFGAIGTAIASASTIAPITPIVHITGTTGISTITVPSNCNTSGEVGCSISLVPDGLWSTATGGNIAIASTAVVSRALTMIYDPATALWYPSY